MKVCHFLTCSFWRCAICQFVVEESPHPSDVPVVGFLYGRGSSLEGRSGPVFVPHDRHWIDVLMTPGFSIAIEPVEESRGSFDEHSFEAVVFHYDCYLLLRKLLQANDPAKLDRFVWHLASSISPLWPIWPAEHSTRSKLWMSQIWDRISLRSQQVLAEKYDPQAAGILTNLIKLPEELLEQIPCRILPCAWARLAAVCYVSSLFKVFIGLEGSDNSVDLHADLFVLYIPIAGRKYMGRIKNYAFPRCEALRRVASNDQIIVCSDEIGILNICAAPTNYPITTSDDGMTKWLQVVSEAEQSAGMTFQARRKGFLLYEMHSTTTRPLDPSSPSFIDSTTETPTGSSSPSLIEVTGPQTVLPRTESFPRSTFAPPGDSSRPCFIYSVDLRGGITGISVAFSTLREDQGGFYISLRSHRGGEAATAQRYRWNEPLDSWNNPNLLHQYFPLAEGERVTQIWERRYRSSQRQRDNVDFTIQTNRKGPRTFGPWLEDNQPHTYTPLVHADEGAVNTLFYSNAWTHIARRPWDKVVVGFSVRCDENWNHEDIPEKYPQSPSQSQLLSPLNEFDQEDFYGFVSQDWHFSEAPLDGVIKIERCLHPKRDDDATAGVMFHYADRKEVIGQWNFNWLIVSHDHAFTHITLRRYMYSNRKVPSVSLVPRDYSTRQDTNGIPVLHKWWLEDDVIVFPLSGRLIWSFSRYGDVAAVVRPNRNLLTPSFLSLPPDDSGRM